ncbi:MAG: flagellar export protein FliJ [Armatimonadota bacterium]|nr:flagellar export protein FliJ [bacterium]
MKRFKFRLQTLLDQRKSVEDILLAELAEVRREEAAEVERLDSLYDRLEAALENLETAMSKNDPIEEISRLDEYAKATRDDIKVQQLTLEAVRERVEAKRLEVVKAMQDRQVLEALRDKQEAEYLAAVAKAEQNELDEMASLRYARGM